MSVPGDDAFAAIAAPRGSDFDDGDHSYFDDDGRRLGAPRRPPAVRFVDGAPENSEEYLALRFARGQRDAVRYVHVWGRWYRLVGHRWRADDTLATFEDVRELCRRAASGETAPRDADALASARTARAVELLARSDRRLAATVDQWDADPFLLNTPGGVFDLKPENWGLRPQRPADYLTKSTAVAPLAVAPARGATACPLWMAFLTRVTGGDEELIRFLQRVAGYFLTGDTSAHALFFAYGTGANGKSVFVNTLSAILGDYAKATPMETFMASRDDRHPTELANLRAARLVTSVETEEGRRWAESRIKQLTGGDKISARFMRQDFFEFQPQFKLLIAGNHKPALRGVDEAIRRRFHLLPFTVTIPKDERDPSLTERLRAEWPAILAWAITGLQDFFETGLAPPSAVLAATDEYLDGEDAFSLWREERFDLATPSDWTSSTRLFESWSNWAEEAGEHVGSLKRLSEAMKSHGYVGDRRRNGRGFLAVRLKERPLAWLK
jgi:putative DNA primase/helicase